MNHPILATLGVANLIVLPLAFTLGACGAASGGPPAGGLSGDDAALASETSSVDPAADAEADAARAPGKRDGDGGGDSGYVMPVDDAGWTQLPPPPDGGTIYVSSSDPAASDANSGLSASAPIKTLGHATTLAKSPSVLYVLLKRGDTFRLGSSASDYLYISHGGASSAAPFVVSAYGTGARPKLVTSPSDAGASGVYTPIMSIGPLSHVAITSLDVGTPPGFSNAAVGSTGIRFVVGGNDAYDDILLEDLSVHGFYDDVVIQTSLAPATNVRIRRNEILDSYKDPTLDNPTDRPQGIYGQNVVNAIIEENIFDENGDGPGSTTEQGHTLYWQAGSYNATFRGNLVLDAPDSIQLRAGGVADDNLFYRNAIALTFACLGTIGVPPEYDGGDYGIVPQTMCQGRATNNVMLDGNDLATIDPTSPTPFYQPRAWGLEMGVSSGIPTSAPAAPFIASNVFAHVALSGVKYSTPFAIELNGPITSAEITGNVIYDWGAGFVFHTTTNAGVTLTGNQVQQVAPSPVAANLYAIWMLYQATLHDQGNAYYSAAAQPFVLGADDVSSDFLDWAAWSAKEPSTGSAFAQVDYAAKGLHPEVDLGDYYAFATHTTAGPGSAAAFVAAARAQTKDTWDPRFTAFAANSWFRAQYGVTASP